MIEGLAAFKHTVVFPDIAAVGKGFTVNGAELSSAQPDAEAVAISVPVYEFGNAAGGIFTDKLFPTPGVSVPD
ncbi:MAG TPA: hypothetical protein VGE25_04055 [Sediminibacterium sp.]